MTIELTTNYDFKKNSLGHPERDTFTAANLDMIDTAMKVIDDKAIGVLALADGKIIVGDSEGVAGDVEMSGDVTIDNLGETTIGAGKVGIAEMAAALLKGIVTLDMSFEDGEVSETEVYFPFAVEIEKIRSIVMKVLGGTDAGTITGANSTGASANGEVEVAISAAVNDKDEATPTTNVAVAADSYYKLTTAKATKGGRVLVTLEYKRVA